MERNVPSWMIALIICFAIGCATAFGFFIFYHTKSAALFEQLQTTRAEREYLDQVKNKLTTYNATLNDPIALRQQKIVEIRASNSEEEVAIKQKLLPNHTTAVAEIKEAVEAQKQTLSRLLADARRAQEDLQREEDNTLEAEKQADEDRRRLRDQVRERSQALEGLKEENREKLLVLDAEIDQRQARVQELLDRIDTASRDLESDGQLLRARAASGFVIINRGRLHNLLKGTRFQVYNRRGGKNIIKGEIEIYEVEPRIAIARVLAEYDPNDPLIPGDHIHNLIYNPNEVKRFVIAGAFDRFSDEELTTFIEDAGGVVDNALSTKTHYLVAGHDADAALQEASLLGVTIMSEDQLLEFVRQPLEFRVRQGMTFVLAGQFDEVDAGLIRSFITANGGIIENRVGDGLHVLVAGSGAEDAINQARVLGAKIVTQDELRHLVGSPRDPRP